MRNQYWPALLVKASVKPTVGSGTEAGLVGTIKAAHGMRQVTYGYPLYLFAGNKAPGRIKGQGYGPRWYVANTNGALVRDSLAGTTSATTPTFGNAWD